MLSPREPGKPGIPPTWTANYVTYEQALQDQAKEKTRQSHRRLLLTVVALTLVISASCFIGYALPRLI